jgi:predicted metal-binding membrane protein
MFQSKWESWHAEGVYVLSDDRANLIISSASAWKLLAWKLTAVFKEALRDGHDESEVQRAFSLVAEGIQQFNETYRQPLEACERRMPFLGQHTKFRWCEYLP